MYQNNGFTLIEMLLVLSIIITLSTLAFPYMKKQTAYISNESIQKQILMIIDQAKSQAIISHEKIILNITSHEIYYFNENQKYNFVLPDNYSFNNIKEVYFNKDGNINQANHIDLITPQKKYTLVFHLGAGDYEFKQAWLYFN